MVAAIGVLLAITVAREVPVRPSCEVTDEPAASLPAGTEVEIRFAVADGSNCYKVAATVDGKAVLGYIDGSALAGAQSFDDQRRAGASLGATNQNQGPDRDLARHLTPAAGDGIVELLNSNQPARALQQIEPLLKRAPRNGNLFGLAALAAYRSDDLRRAASYCQDAIALTADSGVNTFCGRVAQELTADKSGEKLYGMRVAVRYEGERLPADVARNMVALLDEEFIRISGQLGCTTNERIIAIVQSRDAYLKTTNAAEWSGGQYDGRIHISLAAGETFGPETRRTFAHETVHACLANLGRFPAWLHEGLAQKLSGDTLPEAARSELRDRIGSGAVPKLENLGQNWSGLSARNARLAYNLALAAAGALLEHYSAYGIQNVLRNPGMLEQITPEIDKALGL